MVHTLMQCWEILLYTTTVSGSVTYAPNGVLEDYTGLNGNLESYLRLEEKKKLIEFIVTNGFSRSVYVYSGIYIVINHFENQMTKYKCPFEISRTIIYIFVYTPVQRANSLFRKGKLTLQRRQRKNERERKSEKKEKPRVRPALSPALYQQSAHTIYEKTHSHRCPYAHTDDSCIIHIYTKKKSSTYATLSFGEFPRVYIPIYIYNVYVHLHTAGDLFTIQSGLYIYRGVERCARARIDPITQISAFVRLYGADTAAAQEKLHTSLYIPYCNVVCDFFFMVTF